VVGEPNTEGNMSEAEQIIETIPDPTTIRSRLAQLMREQDILRGLLKVAERKEKKLNQQREQVPA
jgi:hypothetical protein